MNRGSEANVFSAPAVMTMRVALEEDAWRSASRLDNAGFHG
jgi:hypothetical protein